LIRKKKKKRKRCSETAVKASPETTASRGGKKKGCRGDFAIPKRAAVMQTKKRKGGGQQSLRRSSQNLRSEKRGKKEGLYYIRQRKKGGGEEIMVLRIGGPRPSSVGHEKKRIFALDAGERRELSLQLHLRNRKEIKKVPVTYYGIGGSGGPREGVDFCPSWGGGTEKVNCRSFLNGKIEARKKKNLPHLFAWGGPKSCFLRSAKKRKKRRPSRKKKS